MERREAYAIAQQQAKEAGKPCWEYFGCQHGVDLRTGVVCNGNCEKAIKNKEKQDETESM